MNEKEYLDEEATLIGKIVAGVIIPSIIMWFILSVFELNETTENMIGGAWFYIIFSNIIKAAWHSLKLEARNPNTNYPTFVKLYKKLF